MDFLLGKTALVTGGSRGIGRKIALTLANCGADIGIVYTSNDEKANSVKTEIEKMGRKCTIVKKDLTEADCADVIAEKIPKADILIHNASIQYRNQWENITADQFESQINCNLRAVLMINQKYVEAMKQNKWGRIITIGSVQEKRPHTQMLVYSISKCALTAMARTIAPQLAPFGITVNSVAPGIIMTDRNTEALSDEEYRKISLAKVPAGRFGETGDCAGIIELLCSDKGEYITGQNIFVDGGMGLN